MIDRRYLDLKSRYDFKTFIRRVFMTVAPGQTFSDNWHIDAMAHLLERCASGDVKRGLITLPPRHLKSICASVAFSAWLLGHTHQSVSSARATRRTSRASMRGTAAR
jgi:hypothetical protein